MTLTPRLVAGDREFFGNGPFIEIRVRVLASDDGKSLLGRASMRADETNNGDTKAFVSHEWQIRSARRGESFLRVMSLDSDDFVGEAPDQTTMFERPGKGLVRLYQIVGDRYGADVETDSQPTSVKMYFNLVHFALSVCR